MSKIFYIEDEDNEKDESISKYNDLFKKYINSMPSLSDALNEMYILSKLSKEKAEDLTNDILKQCKEKVEPIFSEIHSKYQNISQEDAMIITSYTCESKDYSYSPYRILNKNLISEDRKNGLKIISKYLYIFLCSLRKLPRYYPNKTKGYLYRCINKQINYMINPFKPKLIPYIQGNKKIFWGFTSTSPNIMMTYKFLGEKKQIKNGTIFSLFGNVWGYDITLFNVYKEEEILLEPERKFTVEQILPPVNEIIYVTCKLEDSPIVLNFIPNLNQIQSLQNQISIFFPVNNNDESKTNKNTILREYKGSINANKNINIKFFSSSINDNKQSDSGLSENSQKLSSLLKLCALKEISNYINDEDISKLPESLRLIFQTLQNNYISQSQDIKNDIMQVLENTGNNILNFSPFVDNEVKPAQIEELFKYLKKLKTHQIEKIINKLSKYENEMKLFNKEFIIALRESIFEFSVVSAIIIERVDFEVFKKEKEKCPNCEERILFHGTPKFNISSILTDYFKKSTERGYQHGKGVYFTDQIDHCWYYGNPKDNRINGNKIPSQDAEFTMIVCSIYYDKTRFRKVYDHKYTPKKNEINFAYVGFDFGTLLNPNKNKICFTDYVIYDLDQICPFLSIKLKREEYCIIWRDKYFSKKKINNYPYFENNKKILSKQLINIEQYVNYNVYPCDSTKEALKLVQRKKFNKIILISNIGNDYEGKIFIDEARKLIENDIVALFFTYDINKHLEWVSNYKNALIANEANILERYVKCFNGASSQDIMKGIIDLKNDLEKKYNKKFNFNQDFLNFPLYKDSGKYSDLKI